MSLAKNGKMPAKGEIFKNPQLAKTLQVIAEKAELDFMKDIRSNHGRFYSISGWFFNYEDFKLPFILNGPRQSLSNYRGL